MKFNEAMELLKSGKRVTRQPWLNKTHFELIDGIIKNYYPVLTMYNYTAEIMLSNEWKIEGREDMYQFQDIISFLIQGMKAKLNHWGNDEYIYYDKLTRCLNYHCLEERIFHPDFESFLAQDWVLVE